MRGGSYFAAKLWEGGIRRRYWSREVVSRGKSRKSTSIGVFVLFWIFREFGRLGVACVMNLQHDFHDDNDPPLRLKPILPGCN